MSEITPPSNISYGTVVWRAAVDIADTDDIDTIPDYVPPTGTVTLTATTTKELDATATPDPVTILRAPIQGVLDDQGYLCTPNADGTAGSRGLKVIATDDPDLNPTGWLYNVTYNLRRAGKVIVSPATHLLAVPTNGTVDLTTVIPPDAADAIGVPQAEAAAAAAALAALAAQAALEDLDPTAADLVADPTSELSTSVAGKKRALDTTDAANASSNLRVGLDPAYSRPTLATHQASAVAPNMVRTGQTIVTQLASGLPTIYFPCVYWNHVQGKFCIEVSTDHDNNTTPLGGTGAIVQAYSDYPDHGFTWHSSGGNPIRYVDTVAGNQTETPTTVYNWDAQIVLGASLAISSSGVVTLNGHKMPNGQQVHVTAKTGATGLTVGQTYYVVNATTNTFQLAATKGGSAITTTSGTIAATAQGAFHHYYSQQGVGINQSTLLARSYTGLVEDWVRYGIVLQGITNGAGDGQTTYAKIGRIGHQWYAYHLMGGGDGAHGGMSWSNDGISWVTDRRRFGYYIDVHGDNGKRLSLVTGTPFEWMGKIYAFCKLGPHASGFQSDDADIDQMFCQLSPDLRSIVGRPVKVLPGLGPGESETGLINHVLTWKNKIYAYYRADTAYGTIKVAVGDSIDLIDGSGTAYAGSKRARGYVKNSVGKVLTQGWGLKKSVKEYDPSFGDALPSWLSTIFTGTVAGAGSPVAHSLSAEGYFTLRTGSTTASGDSATLCLATGLPMATYNAIYLEIDSLRWSNAFAGSLAATVQLSARNQGADPTAGAFIYQADTAATVGFGVSGASGVQQTTINEWRTSNEADKKRSIGILLLPQTKEIFLTEGGIDEVVGYHDATATLVNGLIRPGITITAREAVTKTLQFGAFRLTTWRD